MSAEYISIKQGKDHVSSLQINKNREIIVIGAIKHGKRLRVKKKMSLGWYTIWKKIQTSSNI
jgi:hypothetical protein